MAKTFECRQAGLPCGFKAMGQSEEEVLAKAVAHAKQAHGVDLTQSATLERYTQSLVRDKSEQTAEAR